MLKYLTVCFMILSGFKTSAQHFNAYSNYLLNTVPVNCASIGKDEALDVNLYARNQWTGLSGNPVTYNITASSMIRTPALNLGLMAQSDMIGSTTTQNFTGMYTYRVKFRKFKMALGLQSGVEIINYNLNKLKKVDDVDAVVSNNQNQTINYRTGAGLYLHNNNFFFGISSPYLFNSSSVSWNQTPAYLLGGLILKVRKSDLVKPSFLIRKINGSPLTFDASCSYYFLSKLGIGVSYRYKNAIIGLAEFMINDQIRIGYCYDFATTAISKYQSGSHEISLRALFGKKYKTHNPRALLY
jgi:type IX secretion system PorP/SprF family membrane protein